MLILAMSPCVRSRVRVRVRVRVRSGSGLPVQSPLVLHDLFVCLQPANVVLGVVYCLLEEGVPGVGLFLKGVNALC